MAGATVVIEATIVGVILGVTVRAITVRTGEYRGFMARIAFEIVVFTEQWKTGQVVNEHRGFLPRFLSMAIVALVTLLAVVNLIFKVARCTASTRRSVKYRLDMTIDAGNRWMRAT